MGKVRTRPESGRLYFDFIYKRKRCREQTALEDTPENRKLVEKTMKRIDAEITLGTFEYERYFPNSKLAKQFGEPANDSGDGMPTLREFSERWFNQFEVTWRMSHKGTVRILLDNHILPYLGDKAINQITRDDVLEFRAHMTRKTYGKDERSYKNKSVNDIVGVLGAMMNEASLRYQIVNPCAGLKRLKVQRTDIEPFSLDEVQTIIASIREDYHQYMVVRFFTGMRSGELHGLKWKNVDFERRQILVRETWSHGRTEYTKTDGSQREIEMSQIVYDALKKQAEATQHMSEYVFCTHAGGPLDTKNFTARIWYPLLRHLGLKERRPYQTRHTCATLWLAAGENPEWVARQLGHANTEMLFRVYSRYIPNLTRKDGSAFDRLITSAFVEANS